MFSFCFFVGLIGIIIVVICIFLTPKAQIRDAAAPIFLALLVTALCIVFGVNKKVEVEHKVIEIANASCSDSNCKLDHSDNRNYYIILSNGDRVELTEDEYTVTKVGDTRYVQWYK